MWFVCILRCADGSLYVGHTRDLDRRTAQHATGEAAEYTRERLPIQLVYVSECGSRLDAFQRERQLKKWSRAKKEALIAGRWDEVRRLAAGPEARRKRELGSTRPFDSAAAPLRSG